MSIEQENTPDPLFSTTHTPAINPEQADNTNEGEQSLDLTFADIEAPDRKKKKKEDKHKSEKKSKDKKKKEIKCKKKHKNDGGLSKKDKKKLKKKINKLIDKL